MHRSDILDTANKIINGKRQDAYGKAEDSFALIAEFWSVWLRGRGLLLKDLRPYDVAQMMSLLKKARAIHDPTHVDSAVDDAGYTALAGEIGTVHNDVTEDCAPDTRDWPNRQGASSIIDDPRGQKTGAETAMFEEDVYTQIMREKAMVKQGLDRARRKE